MIFHENLLLPDDSHEISYLIFFENWERCRKVFLTAAVVIGTLRVKCLLAYNEQSYWDCSYTGADPGFMDRGFACLKV